MAVPSHNGGPFDDERTCIKLLFVCDYMLAIIFSLLNWKDVTQQRAMLQRQRQESTVNRSTHEWFEAPMEDRLVFERGRERFGIRKGKQEMESKGRETKKGTLGKSELVNSRW